MNICSVIRQKMDSMTKSERLIAQFALEHPQELALLSLEKAAGKIGVSTTSVIRFSRSVGLSGFRALQEHLRQDLHFMPDLTEKFHRAADDFRQDDQLHHALQKNIACIQQLGDDISSVTLTKAIEHLANARRIFTFGMRESFALAHYIYTRLLTVRSDVHMLSNSYGSYLDSVAGMDRQDVCLFCLFPRYTKTTVDVLKLLHQQNIPVLLITAEPSNSIREYADVLLSCQVDVGGIKNSFAAPICLADHLCNALAIRLGDQALAYMKKLEKIYHAGNILTD